MKGAAQKRKAEMSVGVIGAGWSRQADGNRHRKTPPRHHAIGARAHHSASAIAAGFDD